MRPNTVRWARFGPTDRSWFVHVPPGGFCLSGFVVVRDRRGGILLGRPRRHPAWPEKGSLPYWRIEQIGRRGEWILPASHLMVEESPEHAARRIARDWAGLPAARPWLLAIDSSRRDTGRSAGSGRSRRKVYHWDVGFIYGLRSERIPAATPWWKELKFFAPADLRKIRIGRAHRDIVRLATGIRHRPA